jgi:uncharacterized protein (DUF697 family)
VSDLLAGSSDTIAAQLIPFADALVLSALMKFPWSEGLSLT